MSKVLTEVSTYTASITVPEAGDPAAAGSSIEVHAQALANRTKFLKDGKDTNDAAIASILAHMPGTDISCNLLSSSPSVSLYTWAGAGVGGTIGIQQAVAGAACLVNIPCRVGRTYGQVSIVSKLVGSVTSTASLYISRMSASGVVRQSELSSSSRTLATTSWATNNYTFTPFVAADGDFIQLAWSMGGATAYPFYFLAAWAGSSY